MTESLSGGGEAGRAKMQAEEGVTGGPGGVTCSAKVLSRSPTSSSA